MCSSRMRFQHIVDNVLRFGDVAFRWNALYIGGLEAGISKRFHFASLHYIFSAYLPTHIKFLTEF